MTRPRRALLLVNPASGRHDAQASSRRIAARLRAAGVATRVALPPSEAHARALAREAAAEGVEMVVSAGGDGTVMAAAGGLLHSDTALLPLPLGTWNGLARSLGAPLDIDEALAAGLAGRRLRVDVGRLVELDRHFLIFAGAGIDAEVVRDTDRLKKRRHGYWAYMGTLLERMHRAPGPRAPRLHRVRLEHDGGTLELWAHTVMAFNVTELRLGRLPLGPHTDPSDGHLELTAFASPGRFGLLGDLWRLLSAGITRDETEWLRTQRVRIEAEPPLPLQLDGEPVGETPCTLEVLPKALTLLVPATYARARATLGGRLTPVPDDPS